MMLRVFLSSVTGTVPNQANINQATKMGFQTWLFDPEKDELNLDELKKAR